MAAGEEVIGAGDGEAHGVLAGRTDLGFLTVVGEGEETEVRCHVQSAVSRIDPEAMHVGDGLLAFPSSL